MDYRELSDIQIINLSRKGDNEAMEYLLKKYRGMIRKETRRMYLIGSEEEDLTQEGMIGLFKAIRDYDENKQTDFALFAHICIVRQIYNAVTASKRQKNIPLNTYVSFYAPLEKEESGMTLQEVLKNNQDDPERRVIEQERVEEIWRQIDRVLSPLEKKVLFLYLDGDSYFTIGEKLGKEKKAIDNAIQRIRMKLSSYRN